MAKGPETGLLDSVDSLLVTCMNTCVKNIELLADRDDDSYRLKDNLVLPTNICQLLLECLQNRGYEIDDSLLHIFADTGRTRLCRAKLRNCQYITDEGAALVIKHNLVELDLLNCPNVSPQILEHLDGNCRKLRTLCINRYDDFELRNDAELLVDCPSLRILVARNLFPVTCGRSTVRSFTTRLLKGFTDLHVLDVSSSLIEIVEMPVLRTFSNLSSLIMFDCEVERLEDTVRSLTNLKSLRHLDISQDFDDDEDGYTGIKYSHPEKFLRQLVQGLPKLISLDISCTNLAGLEWKPLRSNRMEADDGQTFGEPRLNEDVEYCPIMGLEGRQFEFLGLYQCAHHAASRLNIPAKIITGDDTEEQMTAALEHYSDRFKYVEKILDDMFHALRLVSTSSLRLRQFQAITNVMEKRLDVCHVQISASASLYYVAKGMDRHPFTTMKQRRKAVTCLLSAMERYPQQDAMARNGCLTLCNFNIPTDVRFTYPRLIRLLLRLIKPVLSISQDEFLRRISIYLLNSLACQVDGREKRMIGNLGTVELMLIVIEDKLKQTVCDEIMEISWSTLWNITDETPDNCQRFLEGSGMALFIRCLETFENKHDLLRNMMGLMGNIAEVKSLRPQLMLQRFVSIFSDLLESTEDGIEVSYNAAGVLAHMLSDGASYWTTEEPEREYVSSRVWAAISRWKLIQERNINYRSFEPILRLLHSSHTPSCQYWSAWALCNLTQVYPQKYCDLLRQEGGMEILQKLLDTPETPDAIQELARQTVITTRAFKAGTLQTE